MKEDIEKEAKKILNELINQMHIPKELLAAKFRVDSRTITRWREGTTIPKFAELKLLKQIYQGYKSNKVFINGKDKA